MQQPTIRTFLLADLTCYLCGASAGSIEHEQGSTAARVPIHRAGLSGTIGVYDTSRLRCPRCGGSVYIDSVEVVDRRYEPASGKATPPAAPAQWGSNSGAANRTAAANPQVA